VSGAGVAPTEPRGVPPPGSLTWGALSGPVAIALALVGQLVVLRSPAANTGLWLYAVAIGVLLLGSCGERDRESPPARDGGRRDAILTVILVLTAAALRLVLLTQHPGVFGDEGERGMEARRILEGARPPLAGYGWWGVPNVYFYLLAGSLKLGGDGLFGLRLLSAVSGAATVFFVARTGTLLWGRRVGFIAGALLAVSPVALQFSRLAGESAPTSALWAAGFFFVFRTLRDRMPRDAVLAGFLLGGSLYFYAVSKLLLLLVPVLLAGLLVAERRAGTLRLVTLILLAFGVTFLPLAVTSFHQRNAFAGRYRETSIFSPENRPIAFGKAGVTLPGEWRHESVLESVARHPSSWARVLLHQTKSTIDVLYRSGEPTVFYQPGAHLGSILSPLVAPLALLGLAWGLRCLGDGRFAILGLWFWGGLLGPILTVDTPSVQRFAGAWPALMLFPAVLVDHVFARVSAAGAGWRRIATLAPWGLVGTIALLDTREYFVVYRATAPYGDSTAQARYAAALGGSYKVYQLGIDGARYGDVFFGYGPTRFLAKGVEGGDVGALPSRLPIVDENGKNVAFFVYPSNAVFLPMLRLFYPEGREEDVRNGPATCFTAYTIGSGALARTRVLRAVYTSSNGTRLERDEPNLGTIDPRGLEEGWKPPDELLYPARSSWAGAFVATESGPKSVTLRGAGDAALHVDGRLVARENGAPGSARPVVLFLARGLHEVRLDGSLTTAASRITAGIPGPLEPRLIFRSSVGGLLGEVWSGETNLDTLPLREAEAWRLDPFLGFRYAQEDPGFPKGAFVSRWRAILRAPRAGVYSIGLRSNGPSRLTLDGETVVEVPARGDRTASVTLDEAPRSLEVRYAWRSDRPFLELTWVPPGGKNELVPPGVLSPAGRSGPAETGEGAAGSPGGRR
jgi:4-amino-4-deoxy-L-arabinose transferase-like glycosyltransferase